MGCKMVETFNKYNINLENIKMRNILVISLLSMDEIERIHFLKGITKVNLGIELSKGLKEISEDRRAHAVLFEMDKILRDNKYESLLVSNIDILFNPQYNLNALKYFTNLARSKLVFLEWPGTINGNILQYSEINHEDYTRYNLRDYDVALIK